MKNTFKKFFSTILCSLLSVSVLTACGNSVTLMEFVKDSSDSQTLDGYEFKLADKISAENETVFAYRLNTDLGDMVLQRFADVEEQLDCTINRQLISSDVEVIASQIIADSFKYDAFYGDHNDIQDLAQSRVVVPVSDYIDIVDILDYNKYGTPSVQECNSYNGEIIAISPQSWLYMQPTALDILIFNMDYVDRYGKTNPREYIENKTWNWDALETVVSDCYVNEGDITIYSLVCRELDLLKLLILGNGVSFTYKDDFGNIMSDFGASAMMDAIDFYDHLTSEYENNLTMEDNWDYLLDSFVEQQNSMVCLTSAHQLYEEISYGVEDYAVMPFPTGPDGEYGFWPSTIEGSKSFTVTLSADYPESAFRVLDAICEPLDGYETVEDRISYLEDNVVYDPFDAEIALTTHQNGTYSYWKAEIGSFQPDTLWRELAKGVSSANEVIGRYEGLFNQAIAEYMTPNLKLSDYFE